MKIAWDRVKYDLCTHMKSSFHLLPLPIQWTPLILPFTCLPYPLSDTIRLLSYTLSLFISLSSTTSISQVLLFVVDGAGGDGGESGGNNPASDLRCLWKELKLYDEALITKPKLLFINKSDLECKSVLCFISSPRMFHHQNILLTWSFTVLNYYFLFFQFYDLHFCLHFFEYWWMSLIFLLICHHFQACKGAMKELRSVARKMKVPTHYGR